MNHDLSTSRTSRTSRRSLIAATTLSLTAGLAGIAAPAFATAPTAVPATIAAAPSTATSSLAFGPIRPIKPRDVLVVPRLRLLPRYELINTASNLRADVIWASKTPTAGVFLWPDNTSASQEFRMLQSPGGYFRLQAAHSGQCLMLDWRGGKYVNGTPIVQHPDCSAGYAPGEWFLRTVPPPPCNQGPPYFCGFAQNKQVLVNRRTGRCLDAANGAGGKPPARAVLQQWDCVQRDDAWNIGNQAWALADLDPPPSPPIR